MIKEEIGEIRSIARGGKKMKLATALGIIEKREKLKRKLKKESLKTEILLRKKAKKKGKVGIVSEDGSGGQKHLVHVQSILPEDDVASLRVKSGGLSVRDAISKAVYYYLKLKPGNDIGNTNSCIFMSEKGPAAGGE